MIGERRVVCLWLVVLAAAAGRSGIDPQAGLQGSTRSVCSVDCGNSHTLRRAWPPFCPIRFFGFTIACIQTGRPNPAQT